MHPSLRCASGRESPMIAYMVESATSAAPLDLRPFTTDDS